MRKAAARSGADRNKQSGRGDPDFVWPPPEEVLQRITVVDVASGELIAPRAGSEAAAPGVAPPPPPSGQQREAPDTPFGWLPPHRPVASDVDSAGHNPTVDAATLRDLLDTRPKGWRALTAPVPGWVDHARQARLTGLHLALAAAVLLVIAQAAFIVARLTTTSTAPEAVLPDPAAVTGTQATGDVSAPAPPPVQREPTPARDVVATTSARRTPAAQPAATPVKTARLVVRSDPSGAAVTIGGRRQGVTPVTLNNIVPGTHKVIVHGANGDVEQTVTAEAGMTVSVVASLPAGAAAGWISLRSPVELQIFEGAELLGTTRSDRIMLPAGRHTLDLVSEPLGYRTREEVEIAGGETIAIEPALPTGTLHVNALPWAEVWIDGRKAGDTPLGNLSLPIGSHEIVFRHPELGEVKRTVLVTLNGPARVSVNLANPDAER